MDDPWGSPWATSDPPSRNELALPPSPPKTLLSPPPRALISASASPAQSPWLDNDGFGDWTGSDLSQNKRGLTDWGVWGDSTTSQQPQPSPRHDGSGRASPLAWPSSTATSPGLRPLPRSRTSSIYRQSSPDPWAVEFSLKNRRDTLSSFSFSLHEPENTPEEVVPSSHLDTGAGRTGSAREVKLDDESSTKLNKDALDKPRVSPAMTTTQNLTGSITKSGLNEIQDTSPRPSSTFSRFSSQDIDRQDSPITSIDEDSKSRLQPISRKASGKVHELVGMYDDLTKIPTAEPLPTERRETPRRIDSTGDFSDLGQIAEEDDDVADFGDFEDVAGGNGGPGPDPAPISAHLVQPSTPRGHTRDTVPQKSTPTSPEFQSPGAKASSAAVQQLIEKFGPIHFDVDLGKVDQLVPTVDGLHAEDGRHIEVPDRLITDSFTSISERKAWYRISRYGPKRRHDLGDDENYHRITWSNSGVRTDTLKIVRRWMEEDSYTGRAVLGGSKRTSAFNWDSTDAPVDLNTVFGRKSSLQSRTSSVQQGHSTTSSVHSVKPPSVAPVATAPRASTSSLTNTSEVPSTPVAGFAWSSYVSESPKVVDAAVSAGRPRPSIEPPPPPPLPPPTQLATSAPSVARANVPPPIQLPQSQTSNKIDEMADDDDDEDDWGEMMSSPQVETHPSIDQVVSAREESEPPQQLQQQELPTAVESSPVPPAADPWVFADLSVFDAPVGSPTGHVNPSAVIVPSAPEPEPSPATPKADVVTSSPSAHPPPPWKHEAPAPPPTPKAVLAPIEEMSSEREREQENDEIVHRIVQNLPDLSYMLR